LPCSIQAYFPIERSQRSGCTKNLLQYIETGFKGSELFENL